MFSGSWRYVDLKRNWRGKINNPGNRDLLIVRDLMTQGLTHIFTLYRVPGYFLSLTILLPGKSVNLLYIKDCVPAIPVDL